MENFSGWNRGFILSAPGFSPVSFGNHPRAPISVEGHGVSTESGSDRVSLINKIKIANHCYPVATALGTDRITL